MVWVPDPGRPAGPAHPPQAEAAKPGAEALRQAAVAKEAKEEEEKVVLLDVVWVHLFPCFEEIAGRGGLVPLGVGLQGGCY